MGYILMGDGSEFGGRMDAPDRRAIELDGRVRVPVIIIPAVTTPADDYLDAGENGTT